LVASVVLWAEAAIGALGAVLWVALALVGYVGGRDDALALGVLAAVASAGLAALALGIARGRRWATSPAITWQVLQGFVGFYLLTNSYVAYGVVALALAVAGAVALVLVIRESTR
jgi:hypothetical protein